MNPRVEQPSLDATASAIVDSHTLHHGSLAQFTRRTNVDESVADVQRDGAEVVLLHVEAELTCTLLACPPQDLLDPSVSDSAAAHLRRYPHADLRSGISFDVAVDGQEANGSIMFGGALYNVRLTRDP